jgi:hypothetical protein
MAVTQATGTGGGVGGGVGGGTYPTNNDLVDAIYCVRIVFLFVF